LGCDARSDRPERQDNHDSVNDRVLMLRKVALFLAGTRLLGNAVFMSSSEAIDPSSTTVLFNESAV